MHGHECSDREGVGSKDTDEPLEREDMVRGCSAAKQTGSRNSHRTRTHPLTQNVRRSGGWGAGRPGGQEDVMIRMSHSHLDDPRKIVEFIADLQGRRCSLSASDTQTGHRSTCRDEGLGSTASEMPINAMG